MHTALTASQGAWDLLSRPLWLLKLFNPRTVMGLCFKMYLAAGEIDSRKIEMGRLIERKSHH